MRSFKETIEKDFVQFLVLKGITDRTQERYLSDIRYYIGMYVRDMLPGDNFSVFFKESAIQSFLKNRRSSTARSSIKNLLDCFRENRRIDASQYLHTIEYLKNLAKTKTENQMDFLTKPQIEYLLKGKVEYTMKQLVHKEVLSVVIVLAYYFLFDQDQLLKLKASDVNLEARVIRNLRSDANDNVTKWLPINNEVYTVLYLYCNTQNLSNKNEPFLYIKGAPASNNSINLILSILKSKANQSVIQTSVDIQKLLRTRVLLDLYESDGKRAIDFIRIMGLKRNTQLENALEEFLSIDKNSMLV